MNCDAGDLPECFSRCEFPSDDQYFAEAVRRIRDGEYVIRPFHRIQGRQVFAAVGLKHDLWRWRFGVLDCIADIERDIELRAKSGEFDIKTLCVPGRGSELLLQFLQG